MDALVEFIMALALIAGQIVGVVLALCLAGALIAVYVYIRTIDGLLTGNGWLARFVKRFT